MIFNKISFKNTAARAILLFALAAVAAPTAEAAGDVETRLAAELLVMKGDLRRLSQFDGLAHIQKGLRDRLLGASAPLSLLIRAAREDNSRLPAPPLNSIEVLQNAILKDDFIKAKFLIDELIRLYPVALAGILPADAKPDALRSIAALHDEYCSGCHDATDDVFDDMKIERPAWNLFRLAQQMGEPEFAARLIIGVRGDALTAMDNPLSDSEISRLIGLYRNGGIVGAKLAE